MRTRAQARGMLFGYLDGATAGRERVAMALRLLPSELAATLWLYVDNRQAIDWKVEERAVDKFREALALVEGPR